MKQTNLLIYVIFVVTLLLLPLFLFVGAIGNRRIAGDCALA